MAGPAVAILTPRKIGDDKASRIWEFITSRASSIQGSNFWIDGRPFGIDWGANYPEQIADYVGVEKLLMWTPEDLVVIYAMCNDREDHRLLGELCESVLLLTDGVVAFGSLLSEYTDDLNMLNTTGVMSFGEETLFRLAAFREWRKHPQFRMVK